MAVPEAPDAPKPAGGSPLTRKIAGLPAWEWAALLGTGGALIYLLIKRRSAASSADTSTTDTTGTGADTGSADYGSGYGYGDSSTGAGGGTLQPIVDNQNPVATPGGGDTGAPIVGTTPTGGAPGASVGGTPQPPAAPTPPKTVAKPTPAPPKASSGVGSRVNSGDFPINISAIKPAGRVLVPFATVQNGRVVGKNVGQSGAPVYALVKTAYGPVWQQGFSASKLPNGTKIATLKQFQAKIKG